MPLDPKIAQTEKLLVSFLALVNIDSPPRKEDAVMRLLAEQLADLGCRVEFDGAGEAVGGDTGNLIATLPATREGVPSIFLSAHLDTVAPTTGIKTVVENGVVRTDGSTILGADDKAAVAAIVEAVRTVVEENIPHGEVQLLLSICEEIGLLGAVHMDLARVSAQMGFVFDSGQPVGGIVVHSPTHDRIEALVMGKKAHAGAAPENGVSAIHAAAAGIARMKLGRIDAETTANVGVIRGGEATNVIPDRVEIMAEARSRDEKKLETQVAHMVDSLKSGAAEHGATVDVKVTRFYSSFKLSEDDPVVQIATAAARRIGVEPCLFAGGGGSDASIFNKKGLPSVVLGINYQNIHTHEETIAVSDLYRIYELAVALIRHVAGE